MEEHEVDGDGVGGHEHGRGDEGEEGDEEDDIKGGMFGDD